MKVSGTKFLTLQATVVCRKAVGDVGWRIAEVTPDQWGKMSGFSWGGGS